MLKHVKSFGYVLVLALLLTSCAPDGLATGTQTEPTGAVDALPTAPRLPTQDPNATAAPTAAAGRADAYSAAPPLTIDPTKIYVATFKTGKGDIVVELLADKAPITVNNFVFLAREGYYDNTTFHRVLDNFMAQGGDPTATGGGGPGYQFEDEFHPDLTFDAPGLLAMANAGPGANGSQFLSPSRPPRISPASTPSLARCSPARKWPSRSPAATPTPTPIFRATRSKPC